MVAKFIIEPHSFIILTELFENAPADWLYGFPVFNPQPKLDGVDGFWIALLTPPYPNDWIADPDVNPDVPAAKATLLITQLQAYSAKFAMMAAWYSHVKKDDRSKKNMYYAIREATDKLVDALKYSVRNF